MAERRTFPVVNFRSSEYLLNIESHKDLTEIMLSHPDPFGISHAPDLRPGRDQYELGLWDGDDDIVYLGVNHNPYSGRTIDAPKGLFYLEREKMRLLYDPKSAIPLRDSYRGFYQNDFGTTAKLGDVIQLLEVAGLSILQITSLFDIPGVKELTRQDPSILRQIEMQYATLKPHSSIFQPYRIEGKTDSSKILAGKYLHISGVLKVDELMRESQKMQENWVC